MSINPDNCKRRIYDTLTHWEARYNGDNDLIPGAPVVTASDMAALEMIRDLLYLIEFQQAAIEDLARRLSTEPDLFDDFSRPPT